MPSNPNKEVRKFRNEINTILSSLSHRPSGLPYYILLRSILGKYDVSEQMAEQYISKYWISPGEIVLKDGVLFAAHKEESQQ